MLLVPGPGPCTKSTDPGPPGRGGLWGAQCPPSGAPCHLRTGATSKIHQNQDRAQLKADGGVLLATLSSDYDGLRC